LSNESRPAELKKSSAILDRNILVCDVIKNISGTLIRKSAGVVVTKKIHHKANLSNLDNIYRKQPDLYLFNILCDVLVFLSDKLIQYYFFFLLCTPFSKFISFNLSLLHSSNNRSNSANIVASTFNVF
jgi:hypothetical protein